MDMVGCDHLMMYSVAAKRHLTNTHGLMGMAAHVARRSSTLTTLKLLKIMDYTNKLM